MRLRDWSATALLVMAQMVVCQRLYVTGWTAGLEIAVLLTVLGVMIGLALGLSGFTPGKVLLLGLGYSLILVPLIAGGLYFHNATWLERLSNLGGRLASSFGLFATRRPVEDPILFVAFVAVGFWVISLTAGYALTRAGNFLGAVLPGGIALFIIQLYDPGSLARLIFLGVYFFLSLLLLGRLAYLRKRSFWKEQRVALSSESAADIGLAIFFSATVLVLLTWLIPTSRQPVIEAKVLWDKISRPLQQARQDLGNAVAGLESNHAIQTSDVYGDTLALGQRAAVSRSLVFTVQLPLTRNVVRYYWRVRTYDLYTKGAWQNPSTDELAVSPGGLIDSPDARGLPTSEFTFKIPQANIAVLIMPPRPVWISHPAVMAFLPLQGSLVEPVFFTASPPILAGEEYKVHAAVYNPTIQQLTRASTTYPAWVTDHYLQLPKDLPPAITDLARQITAGLGTPYDRAQAITHYLRDNIQYTPVVPPVPSGQDPLAWFLFSYKAGFCNYYASAEVVLLRAVGIPSRLAVGYAEGEYQPPDKLVVRQQDAHAWPEVYFPGSGWVEFEPTVSQAPLDRPSGELLSGQEPGESTQQSGTGGPPATPVPSGEANPGAGAPPNSFLRLSILFVVLLGILAAGWLATMYGAGNWILHRLPHSFQKPLPVHMVAGLRKLAIPPPAWLEGWARFASLTPIERSFGVVYRSLRRLGGRTSPAQTAAEAASALAGYLPKAAQDIHTLLDEYQRTQYSENAGDLYTARRAAESIRRQSQRAVFSIHLARLQSIFRKAR